MSAFVRRRRSGNRSRGQALVEFAIAFPVVMVLFMAIFDLARVAYYFNAVSDAARNGVREAIVDQNCTAIATATRRSAPAIDLSATGAVQVKIYKTPVVSSTPAPDTCPSLYGGYGIGNLAEVTVQASFTPITPGMQLLLPTIVMNSHARLPLERVSP